MKNYICIALFLCAFFATAQVPFHKGVNLTGWFQASSPRQIQFTRFTRKDFENIKSLGCDVIRLPINLHSMTSGAPDHTLDPLFTDFLDQAIDWSEELSLYLILDNHSFDPSMATDPAIEDVLVKVWPQLANRYKERSDFLLYEVLNEPHGISDPVWSAIQQSVIDAIRIEDPKHYIIVGGSNYNSYVSLANLPNYADDKLIYTFHFYDPFLFTHQGASWVEPSLVPLSNMPFPYKSASMPALPNQLKGTWIESAYNNYPTDGTVSKVRQLIDIAANFKATRNVPVFCGEFGVYMPNSNDTDRVAWYKEVKDYLDQKNIPWTIWDYTGGFGLFKKGSDELFNEDINVPLLESLAFEIPPQNNYTSRPLTKGFTIYDDFAGAGIITSGGGSSGTLDYYYNTESPYNGEFSIYWNGVNQYENIGFDFKPNVNLSLMPDHDYQLTFWVRGQDPGASFDIRFVDTKTSSSDHPWRMGKTIDENVIAWDGEWHQVSIPLNGLEEKGSWDEQWYNPENKFDWSAVDRFEIVAEQMALTGIEFSFDDIKIEGEEIEDVVGIEDQTEIKDFIIYPNPVSGSSHVEFFSSKSDHAIITVYNPQGQDVRTLLCEKVLTGKNKVYWNGLDNYGQDLVDGLYFVRIFSGTTSMSTKIIVLKK